MRTINRKKDYFNWLCGLVEGVPDLSRRIAFLEYLHGKEFHSEFSNDGNRAADGEALRERYFYNIGEEDYPVWGDPCSILEMLIALSQRIEFLLCDEKKGNRTSLWFWEMIGNLGLHVFENDDLNKDSKIHSNDLILEKFHRRNYSKTGQGGLFPLKKRGVADQRDVEIWYQMQAYIQEKYS